ncbi:MAG: methyltransferase domain-containing protein [Candidatus Nanoarchaeia archaeon]
MNNEEQSKILYTQLIMRKTPSGLSFSGPKITTIIVKYYDLLRDTSNEDHSIISSPIEELEKFPYETASVDSILLDQILPWFDIPSNTLYEADRVLKPNGDLKIVLTTSLESDHILRGLEYRSNRPFAKNSQAQPLSPFHLINLIDVFQPYENSGAELSRIINSYLWDNKTKKILESQINDIFSKYHITKIEEMITHPKNKRLYLNIETKKIKCGE